MTATIFAGFVVIAGTVTFAAGMKQFMTKNWTNGFGDARLDFFLECQNPQDAT